MFQSCHRTAKSIDQRRIGFHITGGMARYEDLAAGKDKWKEQHIGIAAERDLKTSLTEQVREFTAAKAMPSIHEIIMIRAHPVISGNINRLNSARFKYAPKFSESHRSIINLTDHIGGQNRIKMAIVKGKSLDRTLFNWH